MSVDIGGDSAALLDGIRASLRAYQREQGITEKGQARLCGVSVSGFNEFMAGKYKGIDPRMWGALYRSYPKLRWDLEEYNRQRAMEGSPAGAAPAPVPAETANAPPARPRSA